MLSETKIDLALKNPHSRGKEEKPREKIFLRFREEATQWSRRESTAARALGGNCGGEESFPRFSTFSTDSHHRHAGRLRTGCCVGARMVGIIATNRSHKLKSFHGISTLPFSIRSHHDFPPTRGGKKTTKRDAHQSEKETHKRRMPKGGVYEKLSSPLWILRGSSFSSSVRRSPFCLAFWGSHCRSTFFSPRSSAKTNIMFHHRKVAKKDKQSCGPMNEGTAPSKLFWCRSKSTRRLFADVASARPMQPSNLICSESPSRDERKASAKRTRKDGGSNFPSKQISFHHSGQIRQSIKVAFCGF